MLFSLQFQIFPDLCNTINEVFNKDTFVLYLYMSGH
uniref:Uncharacterized protein n=1 Tax=Anguilla anguilla TaxID=7936 RepID=A0A0E9PER6_ANGAN